MLKLLVNNIEANPAAATLFPEQQADFLAEADEDDTATPQPPPPLPKEWMETVYTFQDLQSQAELCTWIGELQK